MKKPELSIIVVSYNTKELLKKCLESLEKVKNELDFETIVVDNASSDGSPEMVSKKYKSFKLLKSEKNLGFSAGNNLARKDVNGKHVLFLNSDTVVHKGTLKGTVQYMKSHKDVGALTCRTILPNGKDDRDARRSFPTPWVALSHFLYLDRLFPHSPFFSRYWYGHVSPDTEHEVDVLQGAFFLSRKNVLDDVGWYDETYFLNGEDIDLSWKIKKAGWKIMYVPRYSITHVKKASKRGKHRFKNEVSGVKSMEIFYRNRMWDKYPFYINWVVIGGIHGMKIIRGMLNLLR